MKLSDFIAGRPPKKILKALLSDVGVRFRKTHEIGALLRSV